MKNTKKGNVKFVVNQFDRKLVKKKQQGHKKKGQFKGTERFKKKPNQMQLKNPVKN